MTEKRASASPPQQFVTFARGQVVAVTEVVGCELACLWYELHRRSTDRQPGVLDLG